MKRHVTTPMYYLLTYWPMYICVNYKGGPISKHLALSKSYLNEIYLSQTISFTVKTWVSSFVFNMKAVEEGGRCCCCWWWRRRWRRRCTSLGIVNEYILGYVFIGIVRKRTIYTFIVGHFTVLPLYIAHRSVVNLLVCMIQWLNCSIEIKSDKKFLFRNFI